MRGLGFLSAGQGNPLGASRNLAWLLTMGFHLALGGMLLGGLALTPARRAPEPSPSLVLRLTPAPARQSAPAPKPAEPSAPPVVTPTPPPPPHQARPTPRTRTVAQAPPAPEPEPMALAGQPPAQPVSTAAPQAAMTASAPAPAKDDEALRRGMIEALAALLEREKRYPLAARRANLTGRVMLVVDFDGQGRPQAWRVERGEASEILGRAALESMERAVARLSQEKLAPLAGRQVRVPMVYRLE